MKKLKKKKSKQEIKEEEKKIKDNLDEVMKYFVILRMLAITSEYCKIDFKYIDEIKLNTTSLTENGISKYNDLIHRFAKLIDKQGTTGGKRELYELLKNKRLQNTYIEIRNYKLNLYTNFMIKNIDYENRDNIPNKDVKYIMEMFVIFDILREIVIDSKEKVDIYIKQLITKFNNSIRNSWYDDLFLLNVG